METTNQEDSKTKEIIRVTYIVEAKQAGFVMIVRVGMN